MILVEDTPLRMSFVGLSIHVIGLVSVMGFGPTLTPSSILALALPRSPRPEATDEAPPQELACG